MKIRNKILLLLLLGAFAPFVISYIVADLILEDEFRKEARARVLRDADTLSERINERLEWILNATTISVEAVPFENFKESDLPRSLMIPFRQLSDATVIALLDQNGKALVPPYRLTEQEAQLSRKAYVTPAELDRFASSIPLQASLQSNVAVGPVYWSDSGEPRIAAAVAFESGQDQEWVLAVGLSIASICDKEMRLRKESRREHDSVLIDQNGFTVCGQVNGAEKKRALNYGLVEKWKSHTAHEYREYGEDYFAVSAPVELTGWMVLHKRLIGAAMEKYTKKIRWILMIWVLICLAVAIGGGWFFARGITEPIDELVKATGWISSGRYDKMLRVKSRDELGKLARNFNKMTEEVQTWNTELNDRVDEKARELQLAQEQIIKTQKLAALGELGAGIAHEVNNPLTAILGNAQLLLEEVGDNKYQRELLREMVDNSKRVSEVVDAVLRFSQEQWGMKMQPIKPTQLLIYAADFYLERLKEKHLKLSWRDKEDVEIVGLSHDLQIVFTAILDNAIKFSDDGGRVFFDVHKIPGGAVSVTIEDEGVGMTEEERIKAVDPFFSTLNDSRGLGLTTVSRIVDEHEGKVVIDTEKGKGTKVSIIFTGRTTVSRD